MQLRVHNVLSDRNDTGLACIARAGLFIGRNYEDARAREGDTRN